MSPNAICIVLIGIFAFCGQVFPTVLSELSGDSLEQGMLLTALNLLYPVSAGFTGVVADKYGKPPVLLAGSIIMSLPFLLGSAFSGIYALAAATLFYGIGGGILESQGTALLCDANPGRERRMVSLSQAVYCFGAMSGPFLIAGAFRIHPGISWQAIMLGVGCLCVLSGLFYPRLRREPRVVHHTAEGPPPRMKFSRDLFLFSLSLFLYVAVEGGLAGWLVLYGVETFSLSLADAPLILTCYWCCQGVIRVVISFVPLPISNRNVLLASLCGSFVFLAAMMSLDDLTLFYAALVLLSLAMGAFWPTIVGVVGASFKGNSGLAIGIVAGCGAIANALVQIAIGGLSKISALGLRGALACLLAPVVVNVFVVLLFSRRHD